MGKITANGPCKIAYKALRNINCAERPSEWQINDLFPSEATESIVEKLADFFSAISQEFQPLQPEDIPETYDREIVPLTEHAVTERLRAMKKPPSMVPGDIPPDTVNELAPVLALSLIHISSPRDS